MSDTLQTKGVSNCRRLELQHSYSCGDEVISRTILDWLRNRENGMTKKVEKRKHLILREYPMRLIRDLVEQVKQDFSSDTPSSSDFLVTFSMCRENRRIRFECERYQFTMDRAEELKTERLSLFVQNINTRIAWPDEEKSGQIYRLWRRRVVNEETDSKIFRWLATDTHELSRFPPPDFDPELFDLAFYEVYYPQY
ncbi:hypothetical protein DdX_12999 [Ditylenchus destructor]|uniref:Uncharacterized protein n=1 Tax=Ditylenchus destructor TaxID=166010 RepID=A0AAD4MVH2_9BILA|nr:hypothetical protein DdX_12999 [Ditylenchus destructor]